MQYDDVGIEKEFGSDGEYLIRYTKRGAKTRNGEQPMSHKKKINPKAFVTDDDCCPAQSFREFASHRSESAKTENSPLFLQVRYNADCNVVPVWYYDKPLGKNSIGELLKGARELLPNVYRKIANHLVGCKC